MYEALYNALKATGIPFAEYAWRNAPVTGSYGVIALDAEAATVWADDRQQAQAMQGTIDLYCRTGQATHKLLVQNVLKAQGVSWKLNSTQFESARQMLHYEWVFELEVV